MFEYDRLSLDVTSTLCSLKNSPLLVPADRSTTRGGQTGQARGEENADRARSFSLSSQDSCVLGSSSAGSEPNFDCSASSGYGSPGFGNTPLASPALDSHSLQMVHALQQMLITDSSSDHTQPLPQKHRNVSWPHGNMDLRGAHGELEVSTAQDKAVRKSSVPVWGTAAQQFQSNDVTATEDEFSSAEIEQFAQLLASPKKVPPVHYHCHICYKTGHYISDCPLRFNSPFEELTPYQGKKKCYGEFQCQQCKRKWNSQNSVANEAQSCIKCHIAVYPHKQLPVDKAVALGLIKSQQLQQPQSPPTQGQRSLAIQRRTPAPIDSGAFRGAQMPIR